MTSRGSIDTMVATASTPDEQVFAEIRGRTTIVFSMAPGYWGRASQADLVWQLTRLAKLMFVARTREYLRIRSVDFGETVTGEKPALGRRDQEYRQARADLHVEGEDASGTVRIACVGMDHWTIQLPPDVQSVMSEEQFCHAVSTAATQLVEAQFRGIGELKHTIYADEPW